MVSVYCQYPLFHLILLMGGFWIQEYLLPNLSSLLMTFWSSFLHFLMQSNPSSVVNNNTIFSFNRIVSLPINTQANILSENKCYQWIFLPLSHFQTFCNTFCDLWKKIYIKQIKSFDFICGGSSFRDHNFETIPRSIGQKSEIIGQEWERNPTSLVHKIRSHMLLSQMPSYY